MLYLMPDLYVYGAIIYGIISAAFGVLVFWTSRNYVICRIKCLLTGKWCAEMVDIDGSSTYEAMQKRAGRLIGRETNHSIAFGSAIRNADGTKYILIKPLGLSLTPTAIKAANDLMKEKGYTSFSEAFNAFTAEYCKQDYAETIGKVLETVKDETQREKLMEEAKEEYARRVRNKIYQSEESWTQNLARLYDFTSQPLDSYSEQNLVESKVLEAEKKARQGGIPMDRVFQYVIIAIVILGATVVIMNLMKQGDTQIINNIATTTTTTTLKTTLTTLIQQ